MFFSNSISSGTPELNQNEWRTIKYWSSDWRDCRGQDIGALSHHDVYRFCHCRHVISRNAERSGTISWTKNFSSRACSPPSPFLRQLLGELNMDVVLSILDEYILDNVYAKVLPADTKPNFPLLPPINLVLSTWHSLISVLPAFSSLENSTASNTPHQSLTQTTSIWPRDNIYRQILSLSVITIIGIHVLYFVFAGLSYRYIFNHDMMRHSRFLPNQVCTCSLSDVSW